MSAADRMPSRSRASIVWLSSAALFCKRDCRLRIRLSIART